jgi:hypothetical protein
MVFHVSKRTGHWGERNYYQGEYDTCFCHSVVVNVPIAFEFRRCARLITVSKVGEGERRERLRVFARDYLGLADLPQEVELPLRPLLPLRRLAFLNMACSLAGGLCLGVVLCTTYYLMRKPGDRLTGIRLACLVIFGPPLALSVLGLVVCQLTRKPSRRQAHLRSVVAHHLGPFSDPADWEQALVARVGLAFGVKDLDPRRVIQEAESRLKIGRYEEALLVARMAVGLGGPAREGDVCDRAEAVTDECLWHLPDA